MRIILLLVLVSLVSNPSPAQKLTLNFLNNWVFECDSTLKQKNENFIYVLNGVLLDEGEIREALSTLNLSRVSIEFLDSNDLTFSFNGVYISIISHEFQEKRKSIRSEITKSKKLFLKSLFGTPSISNLSQLPVLIIDGKQINKSESWLTLNTLRLRDIFNISAVEVAPASIYGKNVQNGLIQVWLKG